MADGRPTRIPLTNFLQASAQVFPCRRVILVDGSASSQCGADGLCGSVGAEVPRGGFGGYRRGVFRYHPVRGRRRAGEVCLRGGRGATGQGATHLIDEALTPQWGVGGATRRGEGASPPLLFVRADTVACLCGWRDSGVRLKSDTECAPPSCPTQSDTRTPLEERAALVGRDARERERQPRRPAGGAVDLEGAAEHAHALADADDPESAPLRGAR